MEIIDAEAVRLAEASTAPVMPGARVKVVNGAEIIYFPSALRVMNAEKIAPTDTASKVAV
jgi:hypothetical protein